MRAPWLLAIRERASDEFARPMTFDVLEFLTLVITGFTARAEFGSYAFVHPVIRRLPLESAEPASELERNTKSLGAVPGHPFLASLNRVWPPLSGGGSTRVEKTKSLSRQMQKLYRASLDFWNCFSSSIYEQVLKSSEWSIARSATRGLTARS
jgi:hypothetical protein